MPNHALIVLTGHMTRDPELKSLPKDGTPVLKFALAVNTGFGDKKTASFYECAFFGTRAAKVAEFLGKGKPVTVVGEPSIRKWQAQDGKSGTSVDVRVSEIVLLGGRDDHQQQPAEAPGAATPSDETVPF